MNIKAIPTTYACINFRSRLEAKWAAFFDLVGWRWQYEPTDFNGWIPDFAIYGKRTVYVEVKPVVEFPCEVADKIDQSGCNNSVLIVGETIPLVQRWAEYDMFFVFACEEYECCAGWFRDQFFPSSHNWSWRPAFFSCNDSCLGLYSFDFPCYRDLLSGSLVSERVEAASKCVTSHAWRKACNQVQWKPRRKVKS